MNLPPGFELEKTTVSNLPPGFELEEDTKKSSKQAPLDENEQLYKNYVDQYNTLKNSRIPGSGDVVNGINISTPPMDKETYFAERNKKVLKNQLGDISGYPEAALSMAALIPAQLAAWPAAAYAALRGGVKGKSGEELVSSVMQGPTWTTEEGNTPIFTPKSDGGEKAAQNLVMLLQPFGLAPYANVGTLGARGAALGAGRKLREPAPVKPAATIPETAPVAQTALIDPGAAAMQNITDTQLNGWNSPLPPEPRSAMPDIVAQAEQARLAKAQEAIEARQLAMEEEVKRQTSLDMNAAERARQENAPTGYAEYQERLREEANTRQPGDNTPMELTPDETPRGLAETPYQYEGGIDPTQYLAEQKSIPVAVADILRTGERTPDPFDRYSPKQAARRILEEGEQPPIIKQGDNTPLNKGPARGQRGAIDVGGVIDALNEFKTGLRSSGSTLEAFRGTFYDDELKSAKAEALDPKSRERLVWISPDEFHNIALRRTSSNNVVERQNRVREAVHATKGLAQMPQLFVNDGVVWGHEGRHRMDVFKELGIEQIPVRLRDSKIRNEDGILSSHYESLITQNGDVVAPPKEVFGPGWRTADQMSGMGRGQRGVLNFGAFGEEIKKLATLSRDAPSVVAAQKRHVADQVLGGISGYRANITTLEAVIALAPTSKDLTPLQKFNADTWRPGLRLNAINSNNPFIKYANHVIQYAWTNAESYARQYITDTHTGIGPVWRTLNDTEKVELHELLKAGDKAQKKYTPEQLRDNNYSPKQIDFMEKYYAMDDKKYEIWNDKRMTVGLDPVKYREGHFPGNFRGDYRSLVLDKEGSIIGYVGTDTRIGHAQAQEAILKEFPDATFTRTQRKSLSGNSNRGDMFNGMQDLLTILAENDPRIAQIMELHDAAIAQKADATFGADLHAKTKKGIWGNEGNRPWRKDKLEEANDAMKAFFEHWEEGMISHNLMPVEANLQALMRNPELDKMTRAKDYVNEYIKGMTGRNLGKIGSGLNAFIDKPFELLGVGPSVPRAIVNQYTKRMGQWTQGFANIPYTVMQFTQVAQTGLPVMMEVAKSVGADKASVTRSVGKASEQAIKLWYSRLSGDETKLSTWDKEIFKYAEDRGLLTFSEFEEVSQATQSKLGRMFDMTVDVNRTIGEKVTRPYTFLTFVDLLKDSGLSKAEVFDTAFNMTQDTMVDYSARERAPMFKNLGVVGQTAGNLQQFSLTYLDQIGRWHKQVAKGNAAPYVAGMTALLAFAGMQGLPFFSTVDEIVEELTNKIGGKKKNINTLVMENAPEWLKTDAAQYGILSELTGLNISGRLGMADTLPDSFADAISPYASTTGRMAESAYDMAVNRDELSFAHGARQFAPSSMRGLIENKFLTTPEGRTIEKTQGMADYPRTEFDINARKWAMTSLDEAKNKSKDFAKGESLKGDQEKQQKIATRVSRKFYGDFENYVNSGEWKKDLAEYQQRGGDPNTLINKIIADEKARKLTARQRAEGIEPSGVQAIRRWQRYNEE